MQDDLYLISRDGWSVNVEKPISKSGKNKGQVKKSYDYTELHCDLVPVEVLVSHFFSKEAAAIEKTEQMIDAEQVAMETISEEFSDTFEEVPFDTVNGSFIKGVRSLIKEGKKQPKVYADSLTIWEDFDKHAKSQEKLKDEKKESIKKLTAAVGAKFDALTEAEMRELVFEDKWSKTLVNRIILLMSNAQQNITHNIELLEERYETTLHDIEVEVDTNRQLVKNYLSEMGII